jgi:cyclopropane-fatty-acyl-phospholipid synthase
VDRRPASTAETPAWLEPLRALVARVGAAGAALRVEAPGVEPIAVGDAPDGTRVVFRDAAAIEALLRGDHLALAEAYLEGRVDVDGDLRAALFVTDHLDLGPPGRLATLAWRLRFLLDHRRLDRRSIAFHYDRPPDFFLAWLDPRWRSYTHGLYESAGDDLVAAQERKLARAVEALGLEPGMTVFDMGCGWGSFLEYAGRRGIRVHGITLSREQHRFVSDRIRKHELPCSVEWVDFLDYRPDRAFDGAVFMGSLEHMPDYRRVARFAARQLRPGARIWADFVTSSEGPIAGAFLRKYVFPGVSGYVHVEKLVAALAHEGFHVHELADDTASCAATVRDWALRLEASRAALAQRHGEASVRAFLLYLWSSHRFLEQRRTQAHHLVAARERPIQAPASATARPAAPKASPTRA